MSKYFERPKSNLIWFISKWSHFSGQLNILHTFLLTAIFTPLKLVVPQTALCKLIKCKFGCFVNLEPIQKMQIKTQPRLPIMCLMKHNVQRIELTLITANFIKKKRLRSYFFFHVRSKTNEA